MEHIPTFEPPFQRTKDEQLTETQVTAEYKKILAGGVSIHLPERNGKPAETVKVLVKDSPFGKHITRYEFVVKDRSGSVISFLKLRITDHNAYIEDKMTVEHYKGRGISKKLFELSVVMAEYHKALGIEGDIQIDNPSSFRARLATTHPLTGESLLSGYVDDNYSPDSLIPFYEPPTYQQGEKVERRRVMTLVRRSLSAT